MMSTENDQLKMAEMAFEYSTSPNEYYQTTVSNSTREQFKQFMGRQNVPNHRLNEVLSEL